MTRLGITGTRLDPTPIQAALLGIQLHRCRADAKELVHGDCLGADALCHDVAKLLRYRVIVHPPIKPEYRAYREGDVVHEPQTYPVRNANIVHESTRLLAAPALPEDHERSKRSGTWQTVRMARRKRIPIRIIYPDGTTCDEGWT